MKQYQTILFDVDETLLNFKEGQKNSIEKLFKSQGVELTPTLRSLYEAKNSELWTAFEKEQLTKEQVLADRFTYIFDCCGLEKNGAEMDELFRGFLKEEAILLPGATEVVQKLALDHQLYIVTNGVSVTQYRRLEKSGLLPYFKEVFVSEDTGFQKPMPAFFDYVFDRIPNFSKKETLIVGDSLLADIKGGNQAGIASCWYNPECLTNQTAVLPTHQISHLTELLS